MTSSKVIKPNSFTAKTPLPQKENPISLIQQPTSSHSLVRPPSQVMNLVQQMETSTGAPILDTNQNSITHKKTLTFRSAEDMKDDIARIETKCREVEREKEEIQKDHEKCFDRQKELVSQFRAENELQKAETERLRVEVGRLKLEISKGEVEVNEWKDRMSGRKTELEGTEVQVQNLRREIIMLNKKVENCHEEVTKAQLETMKAEREKESLKDEIANLRTSLAKERAEKERYWNQVQEEKSRRSELNETNGKLKDEGKGLYELVERLTEEMKQLRTSNEEALKMIVNK